MEKTKFNFRQVVFFGEKGEGLSWAAIFSFEVGKDCRRPSLFLTKGGSEWSGEIKFGGRSALQLGKV